MGTISQDFRGLVNIHKYAFAQIQPLSVGGQNEGTRLLLGTDITGVLAALVGNPNSANLANQNLVNTSTTTEYLLAAGAAAFDPNCASASISAAMAAGCSTVGTFASCGTGCGLYPEQEQLWADANGGLFSTYPTSLWYPAGAAIWQELRGTLTNMIPAASIGDAGDTMALLSDPNSIINSGTFVEAFNMTDRTYWITNATALANMQQITMGTYKVNLTSFLGTNTQSVMLGCPYTSNGGSECSLDNLNQYVNYGPVYTSNTFTPASDSPGTMPFTPSISFPGAQCFAAYNPTNNNGPETIGRGSGTSGKCIIVRYECE